MTADWLRSQAEQCRPLFDAWLKRLVAIPTISMEPQHRDDIRRCALEVATLVRELDGQAELIESALPQGHPVVLGRFGTDPSHPSVLVYDHLDVQPIADAAAWTTPPFACTRSGERYFGRGTTDAKGPVLTMLLAARLVRAMKVPLNLVFVLDSELELGSPSFDATVAANLERLRCSSIICPDTIWTSREQPVLSGGIRGVLSFLVRLRTAERMAHAGWTGGFARNPLAELTTLLGDCVDGVTGEVKIPGFYDEVFPPTDRELQDLERCGFDPEVFKREHGLRSARTGDALDAARRMWTLPTFELHGLVGGYAGSGNRLIIPDAAEAKLSCRLVPDMTTERTFKLVRDFIARRIPDAEVVLLTGIEPLRAAVEGPLAEAAEAAMELGFGRRPVYVREGVTIPALVSLTRRLAAPIVLMPLSLSDQNYHGPNECFEWFQAQSGIVAYAEYFRRVAQLGAGSAKELS